MKKFFTTVAVVTAFFLPLGNSLAYAEDSIAQLYSREGKVEAMISNGSGWQDAALGTNFKDQDQLRTGRIGRAGVLFNSGVLVRLGSSTVFQFSKTDTDGTNSLNSTRGKLHVFGRGLRDRHLVNTPMVTVAVHGTEFVVETDDEKTVVTVLEGEVKCSNKYGSLDLASGERAITRSNSAPIKSITVNPYDAVQWMLYYPPVLSLSDYADFSDGANQQQAELWASLANGKLRSGDIPDGASGWRYTLLKSLALVTEGKPLAALEQLESAGPTPESPSLLLLRASILLSQGEPSSALAILDQLEQETAKGSGKHQNSFRASALSLKAIVALTQNNKKEATRLVQEALSTSANSSSALLASSYLAQAEFDLETAVESAQQLSSSNSSNAIGGNSFAKARLAELTLSQGDLHKAGKILDEAKALNNNSTYVQAVSGFHSLFRDDVKDALAAFELAIADNSSWALPHLGRALAQIKKGDLEAGRRSLEKAVQLEPNTALYRSYLGKAFFEMGEESLARKEYDTAIKLDPRDPTPHLYRSFLRVSQNEPIRALDDIERSIELNDNRAVYRSRLLLDQDRAAKSAALSNVFSELGFTELARIEAVKTINQNYSNHSGHRLLANSGGTQRLFLRGQVEERISYLLAPLSFNSLYGLGGGESINEYTSLFDKNENRTRISTAFDSRYRFGTNQVVHAGRSDDIGYFANIVTAYADGDRDADILRYAAPTLGLQYQLSPDHRLILIGEALILDHDGEFSFTAVDFKDYRLTLGYNGQLTPDTVLLGQISGFTSDHEFRTRFHDNVGPDQLASLLAGVPPALLAGAGLGDPSVLAALSPTAFLHSVTGETTDSLRVAMQVIHDSADISVVAGIEGLIVDDQKSAVSRLEADFVALFPTLGRPFPNGLNNTLLEGNVYLYLTKRFNQFADLQLGGELRANRTNLDEFAPLFPDTVSNERFNPKIGLTVYPHPYVTARAAYFETLGNTTLADNSSLVPTLVAGVNQRYDDLPSSQSDNYAIGIDFKFPSKTYFGGEWVDRTVDEPGSTADIGLLLDPTFDPSDPRLIVIDENDKKIDIVRAYFYQTFLERFSGTFDYLYRRLKRTRSSRLERTVDQFARFGLRHFAPSGWFTVAQGTWREQRREDSILLPDLHEDLWIFDVGVGYRFPERRGSLTVTLVNVADESYTFDPIDSLDFAASGRGVVVISTIEF